MVLVRGVRDDAPAGAPLGARGGGSTAAPTDWQRAAAPPTLVVTACAVLRAWRDASPGVAFVPRPLPKPAAAASEAAPAPADAPPCKFWVNTGRCALGARCAARHDGGGRGEWVAERRAGRARLAVLIILAY